MPNNGSSSPKARRQSATDSEELESSLAEDRTKDDPDRPSVLPMYRESKLALAEVRVLLVLLLSGEGSGKFLSAPVSFPFRRRRGRERSQNGSYDVETFFWKEKCQYCLGKQSWDLVNTITYLSTGVTCHRAP